MLLLSVSWCFLIFSWFKVLLKFPTILTILFATTCLGSLSNVYKRAQQEVPLSCLLFNIQISREKFSVCLNGVLFYSSLFDTVNSSWSRPKKNIHRLPDLGCFNSNCTTGTPFAFGHHGTNAGGSWWTRPEVSTFRHSGRVWKLWKVSAMWQVSPRRNWRKSCRAFCRKSHHRSRSMRSLLWKS